MSIQNVINKYLKKTAIVQPKALGAEEVTLFMLRAPESKQDLFMNLLSEEKVKEAINLVEDFLQIQSNTLWEAMHT